LSKVHLVGRTVRKKRPRRLTGRFAYNGLVHACYRRLYASDLKDNHWLSFACYRGSVPAEQFTRKDRVSCLVCMAYK
jgi:hypothetical protein